MPEILSPDRYAKAEMGMILEDPLHRYYTWLTLHLGCGVDPTVPQLIEHWFGTGASERFAQWWREQTGQ